ncbi:RNA-binding protein [Blautia liquoris]|uniref:RNA-binding protein n=2 Tax=Blautia liquoris TaxID=2779518 RepID=A0A7M2RLL7_9FIRM|nr:RNA-binding protein [Blautia liquoris]
MDKGLQIKKRLEELADTAYQRSIVTFTEFMDLEEQHMLHSVNWRDYGVTASLFGGYDMAERQMAAFLPDALVFEWKYPFVCVKIFPESIKFSETIGHRDFLGAILNLGITRNRLGDLIVRDNCGYVFAEEKIAHFLCSELTRVKHTLVTAEICESVTSFPGPDEKEIKGSVASLRLDSMIALVFGGSRTSIVPYIENGKVFVNGKMIVSNGNLLKNNDIVSVRGLGKFRFGQVLHHTKKGRNLVVVYRYQ